MQDFPAKKYGMRNGLVIWSFELYQNDTSLDVKEDFEELFNAGKTVKSITDELKTILSLTLYKESYLCNGFIKN